MSLTIRCPHCHHEIQVPAHTAGQRLRCVGCRGTFIVPTEAAAEADVPVVTPKPASPPEPIRGEDIPTVTMATPTPRRPVRGPARPAVTTARRRPVPTRPSGVSTGSVVLGIILAFLALAAFAVVGAIVVITVFETGNRDQANADGGEGTTLPPGMAKEKGPGLFVPPGQGHGNGNSQSLAFEAKSLDQRDVGPINHRLEPPAPGMKPDEYEPPPAAADGSIPREVLHRVKDASVYLRVTRKGRISSGSGFFAFEPGLIVTNAHVVGMKERGHGKPDRVDAILQSGRPGQRSFNAKVVAVDRENDLALLRIQGDRLPKPLTVLSARNLYETQPVWGVGFPYGEELNRNVTITRGSVSSKKWRRDGELYLIQLDGRLNPGNSGGPIVDAGGRAVGVAVSIYVENLSNTGISFAVPGDKVHALYYGQITDLYLGQAVRENGGIVVPFEIRIRDRLGHIDQVGLDAWVGRPGAQRPASLTDPEPQPGDRGLKTTTFKVKGRKVTGEVRVPLASDGEVYWFRPFTVAKDGRRRWSPAVSLDADQPVVRRPIEFATRSPSIPVEVEMTGRSEYVSSSKGARIDRLEVCIGTRHVEEPPTETSGDATRLRLLDVRLGIRADDRPMPRQMLMGLLQRRGWFGGTHGIVDYSKVQQFSAEEMTFLVGPIAEVLAMRNIELPLGRIEPGHSWPRSTAMPLDPVTGIRITDLKLSYTYIGCRSNEGSEQAVVLIRKANQSDGDKSTTTVRGQALIDLSTGLVRLFRIRFDVDRVPDSTLFSWQMSGTAEYRLTSRAAEKNKGVTESDSTEGSPAKEKATGTE